MIERQTIGWNQDMKDGYCVALFIYYICLGREQELGWTKSSWCYPHEDLLLSVTITTANIIIINYNFPEK